MSFVPLSPLWQLLTQRDIAALSSASLVCCSQRTFDVLQVLLLGRDAESLEEIATVRVFLRTDSSGALVPIEDCNEYRQQHKNAGSQTHSNHEFPPGVMMMMCC
eukprot:7877415-Karenia_brevis.AAC.1